MYLLKDFMENCSAADLG